MASECPSISSPLLPPGQARAGCSSVTPSPSPPAAEPQCQGRAVPAATQPGAWGHPAWCVTAPCTPASPEWPTEPRGQPMVLPSTLSPCCGHVALVHCDAPGKHRGTSERAGKGAALQQPCRVKCAAEGFQGGSQTPLRVWEKEINNF